MVLLAPNHFHSPGFSVLGVLGSWKKKTISSFPWSFHSMSMWSFFETGRRAWGYPGGKGWGNNPLLLRSRLPSLPFLFCSSSFSWPFYFLPSSSLCSSISLSRILDHGLWGRSLFSYTSFQLYHLLWRIHDAEANISFHSYFLSYQAIPPRTTPTPSYTPPENRWSYQI